LISFPLIFFCPSRPGGFLQRTRGLVAAVRPQKPFSLVLPMAGGRLPYGLWTVGEVPAAEQFFTSGVSLFPVVPLRSHVCSPLERPFYPFQFASPLPHFSVFGSFFVNRKAVKVTRPHRPSKGEAGFFAFCQFWKVWKCFSLSCSLEGQTSFFTRSALCFVLFPPLNNVADCGLFCCLIDVACFPPFDHNSVW